MTPPYPLAGQPGVHVFLLTADDGVTAVKLATASQHKAAAKWAELFESGADFEAQAWHGDAYRLATAGHWVGQRTWTVTP